MGKPASGPRAPNPHLYARLNHLYQASVALSPLSAVSPAPPPDAGAVASSAALSRFYVSSLRAIGLKSQIRLDPSIKRTLCKRCDTLLVPGATCTHRVENASRGGRKSWADVLVVTCGTCGAAKRFPVGMEERREYKLGMRSENGDAAGRKDPPAAGGKKNGGRKKQESQSTALPVAPAVPGEQELEANAKGGRDE